MTAEPLALASPPHPVGECGTRHRTDEPSPIVGWARCCCGLPWSDKASRCTTGARPGDLVPPSRDQELGERLSALAARLLHARPFHEDQGADEVIRQVAVALKDEADQLAGPTATPRHHLRTPMAGMTAYT